MRCLVRVYKSYEMGMLLRDDKVGPIEDRKLSKYEAAIERRKRMKPMS